MSQSETQPELKNMVSALFGESSDEDNSDDESPETTIKPTESSTKSLAEDDLFNSDDEDDEEPVARRLSKGPIAKKVMNRFDCPISNVLIQFLSTARTK